MRLTVFCAALTLLALPAASLAKPLLLSSEDTYASVCLEGWETPERLLQICELALESPSATTSQRLEMMDTMAWAYVDLGQAKEGCDLFADMRTLNPMSTLGLNGLGCARGTTTITTRRSVILNRPLGYRLRQSRWLA